MQLRWRRRKHASYAARMRRSVRTALPVACVDVRAYADDKYNAIFL